MKKASYNACLMGVPSKQGIWPDILISCAPLPLPLLHCCAAGARSPLGSGEHSQILGRVSPHSSGRISPGRSGHFSPGAGSPSWAGSSKAGAHKWPGAGAGAAAAKQLVDRACSPLIMGQDGSPPPGASAAVQLHQVVCSELHAHT